MLLVVWCIQLAEAFSLVEILEFVTRRPPTREHRVLRDGPLCWVYATNLQVIFYILKEKRKLLD